MKIGIIGLGSIGRKHVEILVGLDQKDIYALRTNKGSLKSLPEKYAHVKEVFSKEEFFKIDFDGIIICTPTHLHVPNIQDVVPQHIPVLVEKPLSKTLEELAIIKEADQGFIKVAFCLRFHPIVQKIKEIIRSGELGKVLKANMAVGQYLPTWHPYADYRTEYYAQSKMGGGALRTLSHELDMALFWFGAFSELTASIEKLSKLEIDVDDNVFILAKHASGTSSNISIDFLASKGVRNGSIQFEKGEVLYDMAANNYEINFYDANKPAITKEVSNNMYEDQMKDFISFIKDRKSMASSFAEAKHIMEVIVKAEESSTLKKWCSLTELISSP